MYVPFHFLQASAALFDPPTEHQLGKQEIILTARPRVVEPTDQLLDLEPVRPSHPINPVNIKKNHIECFDTYMEY